MRHLLVAADLAFPFLKTVPDGGGKPAHQPKPARHHREPEMGHMIDGASLESPVLLAFVTKENYSFRHGTTSGFSR